MTGDMAQDYHIQPRKTTLYLTAAQEAYCYNAINTARAVWNIYVHAGKTARTLLGYWPKVKDMAREFNAVKKASPDLAYVSEVSKFVGEGARDKLQSGAGQLVQ